MECERLEFKRVKCSDMQAVMDMPCQKIQWLILNRCAFFVDDPVTHPIYHKAFNILKCARTNEGNPIVVYNWKKKVEYHWFRFYPAIEWGGPGMEHQVKKVDISNPRCYYLKKLPFRWHVTGIPAGPQTFFFLCYEQKPRPDGLPDVPHADLFDKLSPEGREKLYTTEEMGKIKAYEFGRWYYDTEFKLCKERYENIGRSVLIRVGNNPGVLQDIAWPGKITTDVYKWMKYPPAAKASAIANVGKFFSYMVKPLYGSPQIIQRKEFIYTD